MSVPFCLFLRELLSPLRLYFFGSVTDVVVEGNFTMKFIKTSEIKFYVEQRKDDIKCLLNFSGKLDVAISACSIILQEY